jgi:hypothetical protein
MIVQTLNNSKDSRLKIVLLWSAFELFPRANQLLATAS